MVKNREFLELLKILLKYINIGFSTALQ